MHMGEDQILQDAKICYTVQWMNSFRNTTLLGYLFVDKYCFKVLPYKAVYDILVIIATCQDSDKQLQQANTTTKGEFSRTKN